jgi:hypothetical protein
MSISNIQKFDIWLGQAKAIDADADTGCCMAYCTLELVYPPLFQME